MDRGFKKQKQVHPQETANVFSFITFFYTLDLFKTGYKKPLEEEDLYEVINSCSSKKLGDQLEHQWLIDKKNNKKPSIVRVLWACFGKTFLLFGLTELVMKTIFIVFIPEALGKLISYFAPGQTKLTKEDAYLYAAVVIGLNIVQFVFIQNYMNAITEYGIRVRTAVCSFVYRKALKMTETSLTEISLGKIITLITKDVHAIELMIIHGNDIWVGLFQTFLICLLIYVKIGIAAFVGVGFFLIVLPLQMIIGKLSTIYRLKTSKKTDERLSLTQEVLSAMKIIKMYSWESFFSKNISLKRKKEVSAIYKLFYLKVIIIMIGGLSSKIGFYLLIMTFVWLGNNITAEIVYFVMACFGKLRFILGFLMPLGITYFAEACATIIRLQTILEAEELPSPQNNHLTVKEPRILFKQVNVDYKNHNIFKNLSLEIDKKLNIVIGHLGSGKTTLLKTIMESHKYSGSVIVNGRISYASQEPWLFPSSIKNNILFGEDYNENRYNKVLQVCALKEDLQCLDEGDETIVGDRGINLSKGQQARINLARAVYKESDIYLLDDCLAALDGNVSDYVFQKCIYEFLKEKLVVFVTNNNDLIKKADQVIEIDKGVINFLDKVKTEESCDKKEDVIEIPCITTTKEEAKDEEKNIYKEKKKAGKVDIDVYKNYVKFGGGYWFFGCIMAMYVCTQTAVSYSDKLVSNWVTVEQNLSTFKVNNLTASINYDELEHKRSFLLNLYTSIIVTSTILSLIKFLVCFTFNRNASINIHKVLLAKIMNAKMSFFDLRLIGNVLNRFSKDLCIIDDQLPFVINECFELLFILLGVFALVAIVNPIFLIPSSIFFSLAYLIKHIYQRTGRSLQRLETSTRSPLLGHLNASLDGVATVRAFKAQELIIKEFDRHQDVYTSASYTLQNSMRALGFVLDGMCSLFITIVIVRFMAFPIDTTVGGVGLAISQAFHLSGMLQHTIRRWADFENQMVSVERVLEYTKVSQEDTKGKIDKSWPKDGKIKYDNVSLKYEGDDRKVLKNVNFSIEPGQKIGIVGRTGSGKSSIIATLFRLYDIEGTITIDGVDIKELSLEFLRKSIGIIPQDPILFSGTIRDNIDPLREIEDEEIWKIIKLTKLDNLINNLSAAIDINTNFSAGQKQLICLARAVARKNKIIVLDEATANLDKETDQLVREVVDNSFKNCTVLVIAHRLTSILSSDLVMVVSNGEIIEQDQPNVLLKNNNSVFADMVRSE